MRTDRDPRPTQNFAGGQRSARPAGLGSPAERVKGILRSTDGVAYVSAANPGADFLDRDAQRQAEDFRELHTAQLRRFYGMATAFRRRLEIDHTLSDDDVQAQMAYLKAAGAYAAMRGQPEELPRFFTKHANSVKTRAQFQRFCRHFEAVVAYHKVFGRERGS
jgi:CRISPR-associated protein Csm2